MVSDTVLQRIKDDANGMLPLPVYRSLFEYGRKIGGGTFVEIGTAHGASAIALALGAKESKKSFRLYTVDPFSGKFSSRESYGDVAKNVRFVRQQFSKYGVSDHITIIIGTSETLIEKNLFESVDLLLIDADGCVDRDLSVLNPYLSPACKIIVDDAIDSIKINPMRGMTILDQKHRLSATIVEFMKNEGYLTEEALVCETRFCRRGETELDSNAIQLLALPAYRGLVFADIKGLSPSVLRRCKVYIRDNIPWSRQFYRTIKRFFWSALGKATH